MIVMKKGINYIIGSIIAGVVIFNSLYFRSLDEKLAEGKEVVFDAKSFVDGIWKTNLLVVYDSATEITTLLDELKKNPESTFEQKAQALGIGNIGYFKVKGEGTVLSVNENNVLVQVENQVIEIETEFIFGNAVRDASGLIKVNDYDETSDFNSISESINDKIREEVVPDFRAKVEKGNKVKFKGALELNKAHLNLSQPEIIPVSIQTIQ
jgi:predicted lipoprotein